MYRDRPLSRFGDRGIWIKWVSISLPVVLQLESLRILLVNSRPSQARREMEMAAWHVTDLLEQFVSTATRVPQDTLKPRERRFEEESNWTWKVTGRKRLCLTVTWHLPPQVSKWFYKRLFCPLISFWKGQEPHGWRTSTKGGDATGQTAMWQVAAENADSSMGLEGTTPLCPEDPAPFTQSLGTKAQWRECGARIQDIMARRKSRWELSGPKFTDWLQCVRVLKHMISFPQKTASWNTHSC